MVYGEDFFFFSHSCTRWNTTSPGRCGFGRVREWQATGRWTRFWCLCFLTVCCVPVAVAVVVVVVVDLWYGVRGHLLYVVMVRWWWGKSAGSTAALQTDRSPACLLLLLLLHLSSSPPFFPSRRAVCGPKCLVTFHCLSGRVLCGWPPDPRMVAPVSQLEINQFPGHNLGQNTPSGVGSFGEFPSL